MPGRIGRGGRGIPGSIGGAGIPGSGGGGSMPPAVRAAAKEKIIYIDVIECVRKTRKLLFLKRTLSVKAFLLVWLIRACAWSSIHRV